MLSSSTFGLHKSRGSSNYVWGEGRGGEDTGNNGAGSVCTTCTTCMNGQECPTKYSPTSKCRGW